MGTHFDSSRKRANTALLIVVISVFCLVTLSHAVAEEIEFSFTSSYDKSAQKAKAYIPEAPKGKELPLLVIAHPMGGDRNYGARIDYYSECEKRGWLFVCPDLHGKRTSGRTSLASLEAQSDIMDSINYMKKNYKVDRSRVFLAGRSMGGMLGQIMAAKYPDEFAAVVAGQGISDLAAWMKTARASIKKIVEKECGESTDANRFEYERRSSINYVPNLKYVPLILWHGTNDTLVNPKQSERLVELIRRHNSYQPDVNWLQGAGHNPLNFPPKWICDQLQYYQNTGDGKMKVRTRFYRDLSLVCDEPRDIFWLGITPAQKDKFAKVKAAIKDDTLTVDATDVSRLSVDLEKIARGVELAGYRVVSNTALKLVIKKGDSILLEQDCGKEKAGRLPEVGKKK